MIDYPLIIKLLSVSLVILALIIAYRMVLWRWSRKSILSEDFCELYTLEKVVNAGEISFYLSTQKLRNIRLSLWNGDEEFLVQERTFEPGGHIVRFNTEGLKNGDYFYVLKTENQEVRKRLIIQN